MKISVKDIEDKPKEKVFHPFVLEFKIEDESDLESLAVYLNQNYHRLNDSPCAYNGHKAKDSHFEWKLIDTLLKNKPYMK